MNLFYLNFISIRTLRTFISIRTIRTLRTFFSIRTIRTLRTFFSIRTIRTIRTFISIRTIRTFSPADFKRFKKNSSLLTHHYSYSPARPFGLARSINLVSGTNEKPPPDGVRGEEKIPLRSYRSESRPCMSSSLRRLSHSRRMVTSVSVAW